MGCRTLPRSLGRLGWRFTLLVAAYTLTRPTQFTA